MNTKQRGDIAEQAALLRCSLVSAVKYTWSKLRGVNEDLGHLLTVTLGT